MVNYQLMYMNLLWPIGIQLMTILISIVFVWQMRKQGEMQYDFTFFLPSSKIASKYGHVPQWRLGLFSFWDQLNAVFTSIPGPYISITMQSILTNLNLVWTVVISMIYLGSRYNQNHYIGCILIVFSGLVSITVELTTGTGLNEYVTANGVTLSTSSLWYIIFIVGTIPAGISNCYKEKQLKVRELDIMYASLWSGYWQIFWGLLMFPINWLRMPSPANYNSPGDTGTYLANTFTCFFGTAPTDDVQDASCESDGGSAAYWFVWYLGFNCAFNVLMLWLTKELSATWATIATVLCLDLTSIFGMSKTLMGDEAQNISLEQTFGLVLAGLGMWCYNLSAEEEGAMMKAKMSEEGKKEEVYEDSSDDSFDTMDRRPNGGNKERKGRGAGSNNTEVSFASDRASMISKLWARSSSGGSGARSGLGTSSLGQRSTANNSNYVV
ncbi:hypothetical protein ScalyP_jg5347 [Parmales sp. scaly parma]|nr:hypothetical protein ScalyP_jg5347 [Parmales sp. scaly parma]